VQNREWRKRMYHEDAGESYRIRAQLDISKQQHVVRITFFLPFFAIRTTVNPRKSALRAHDPQSISFLLTPPLSNRAAWSKGLVETISETLTVRSNTSLAKPYSIITCRRFWQHMLRVEVAKNQRRDTYFFFYRNVLRPVTSFNLDLIVTSLFSLIILDVFISNTICSNVFVKARLEACQNNDRRFFEHNFCNRKWVSVCKYFYF